MIYGTPKVHIVADTTDRIGIRTLILSQIWQTAGEAGSAEYDADIPPIPDVAAGMLLVGVEHRKQRGYMMTLWSFEGINGDGKSVTFKDRTNSLDYGFDPAFAQVDIALFPDLQRLLDEGQGAPIDGEIFWPVYVTDKQGGTGLSGGSGASGKQKKNPLFGVKDYLRTEGSYSFRYAQRTLDGVHRGVEKIWVKGLPGEPPKVEDGRNWLKASPVWRKRGTIFDITENYLLSPPGGWIEVIYGKVGGANTGSGLSTGTLQTGSLQTGTL